MHSVFLMDYSAENRRYSLSFTWQDSKQHTLNTRPQRNHREVYATRSPHPHVHEPTGACRDGYASVAAGAATVFCYWFYML